MAIDEQRARELCEKQKVNFVSTKVEDIGVSKRKMESTIEFICPRHLEYGVQKRTAYDLQRTKTICKYCNHSSLKKTFKDEMKKINPTIEILSEYTHWDNKIKCRCKICGYEWDGSASVLLYGGGCKICGYKKVWETRGRKTTEDFKKEIENVNPNIEIIGEYTKSHDMIKCRCKIDGTVWESTACNILNQTAGCPECTKKRKSDIFKLSNEEFLQRVKKEFPDVEIIGEYQNAHIPIETRCNKHNITYFVKPTSLMYEHNSGCCYCFNSSSSGERKLISALENMNISYLTQHIFPDCKYKKPLRFDVYCPEIKTAIEYQGQQHYFPVNFNNVSEEECMRDFENGLLRDNIKREYCKNNNIKLIEIPYWEYDDMESFLSKNL